MKDGRTQDLSVVIHLDSQTLGVTVIIRLINYIVLLTFIILHLGCHVIFIRRSSKETILQLKQKYRVKLDSTWTRKQADILLHTFRSIYRNAKDTNYNLNPSLWKISQRDLEDEVQFETVKNIKHVVIRNDMFPIETAKAETPQEVGQSNKRLYNVVAQFITDEWTDMSAVKLILKDKTNRYAIELVLKEMYGLSLVSEDTPEAEKIAKNYISILENYTFQNLLMKNC